MPLAGKNSLGIALNIFTTDTIFPKTLRIVNQPSGLLENTENPMVSIKDKWIAKSFHNFQLQQQRNAQLKDRKFAKQKKLAYFKNK